MGIPDHLICLLRNLYTGQEATVRTGHGTTDWFQIGKGGRQGCTPSPCLFNLYADYVIDGLDEAQAGIKITGRNSNNTCRWYHPNGRKWRGTKKPLDEGERRKWKSWLDTQHSKNLRSWHQVPSLHGKKMEKQWKQWQTFSWAAKSLWTVTAATKLKDACSLEEKLWQI